MASPTPVELSADCDACGLESGVVEVYDALVPACRFGLPASTRCKLCLAAWEAVLDRAPAKPLREVPANRCPACLSELSTAALDERRCGSCGARASLVEKMAPARFDDLAALERALGAWAERDRFSSIQALLEATFVEPDTKAILEAMRRGQRIEVLADPFANMGIRATGSAGKHVGNRGQRTTKQARPTTVQMEARPSAGAASAPAPSRSHREHEHEQQRHGPPEQTCAPRHVIGDRATASPLAATAHGAASNETPPPSAPPRAIVYPLVSVITADGELHPEELALVDKFLESEGLARLAEHELRVHHPSEVAHLVPRERREEVVKLMCETAAIDGMPDESERRVIRAYARAWDVDDEKLEFWLWGYEAMNTSLARGLWLKIRRFVLSARWGENEARD
jgi:uncharacterized tellurite resistance protein B-like protein